MIINTPVPDFKFEIQRFVAETECFLHEHAGNTDFEIGYKTGARDILRFMDRYADNYEDRVKSFLGLPQM